MTGRSQLPSPGSVSDCRSSISRRQSGHLCTLLAMNSSMDEETTFRHNEGNWKAATALLNDPRTQRRRPSDPIWIRNRSLYVTSWTIVLLFTVVLIQYARMDLWRISLVWGLLLVGQIVLLASIGAVARSRIVIESGNDSEWIH